MAIEQLRPRFCNITILTCFGFTRISGIRQHCCIFRFVGTIAWLRTPGCSAYQLLTCLVYARSHITVAYKQPAQCYAKDIHIALYRKKSLATTPSVVSTSAPVRIGAQIWIGVLILLAVVLGVIAELIRQCRITKLYPIGHQKNFCATYKMVQLYNSKVAIQLRYPSEYIADIQSLRLRLQPSPHFEMYCHVAISPESSQCFNYITSFVPSANTEPLFIKLSHHHQFQSIPVSDSVANMTRTEEADTTALLSVVDTEQVSSGQTIETNQSLYPDVSPCLEAMEVTGTISTTAV